MLLNRSRYYRKLINFSGAGVNAFEFKGYRLCRRPLQRLVTGGLLTGTMVELCFSVFLLCFGGLETDGQLVFQCLVAFLWWVGNGWLGR